MVPIDVLAVRAVTPGCQSVVHFNNAGCALPPQGVTDRMIAHLRREAEIGGYEAAEEVRDEIENGYQQIARLIGARSDEIAFVENATRAWDMAFYGIAFRAGDRILTAVAEYASNFIAYLQMAQSKGLIVDVIPNDETGQLDLEALRTMMDKRVRLISITHVPTNGGLINPTAEVGQIARHAGCLFLLDACQSVGQMPIDVESIGCDFLSATGRKFLRGPRGTGFLYARSDTTSEVAPPMLDLHAARWTSERGFEVRRDARRFENWETNYATKLGLGVAVGYAMQIGIEAIWSRIQLLAELMRRRLGAVPGVALHDLGRTRCGIVTFSVRGRSAEWISAELIHRRINTSVTSVSSSRLDMERRGLASLVRASVHYYNTEDEIEQLALAVEQLART